MRSTHRATTGRRLAALLGVVLLGLPGGARADDDIVPVPDVRDQKIEDARTALGAAGFVVAETEAAGEPEGTVLAQNPAAETPAPRGAIVLVEVRRRTQGTQAPRATGLAVAEAMAALGSLYVLELEPTTGAAADRGKVVGQSPAMGEPLALRGVLRLRFVPDATAEPLVPVPDVAGLTDAEAVQALAAAGLHARRATVVTAAAPPGVTLGQLPLPGTEVARFATVVLVVSAPGDAAPPAAAEVEVPNVTGMSESSARAELERVALAAQVEWVEGDPSQAFLVASQDPAPGAAAAAGSEVRIHVVRYVAPTPTAPSPTVLVAVPTLLGMTHAQADDLLTHLGLVGRPTLAPHGGVPALRVFAQDLTAGRWVTPGTVVGYRIATPPPPPAPVPVPDFYGRTEGGALALAASAGLQLTVLEVVTNAHPPHRVYAQNVAAWTFLPPGSAVAVKLARPLPPPPMATVPELAGRTPGQALALLAAAGLGGARTDVFTLQHPPLRVFAQVPGAGTQVPPGTVVAYKVAKPPLDVREVPVLGGKTKAQALAALAARGLAGDAQFAVAPGKPPGLVFWQSPSPGALRPAGSTVQFRIAQPLLVLVPPVLGMTTVQAKAALEAAGLGHAVAFVPSPGKPAGRVWDQTPDAGASLAPGTVVNLRIAPGIGPAFGPVPQVVGKAKAVASAEVAAAGFVPDVVPGIAPGQPLGKVYAQDPPGNAVRAKGSTVTLRVPGPVLPPAFVKVPNLIGLTPLAAKQALTSKGLVSDGKLVPFLGKPHDRVYSQNLAPNTFVPSGTKVSWRWSP